MKRNILMVTVVGLLLMFLVGQVRAEDKNALAKQLVETIDVNKIIQNTRVAMNRSSQAQIEASTENLRKQRPDLPISNIQKFKSESLKFATTANNSWSSQGAKSVYADNLAATMTEGELKEAITYYQSPAGKRGLDAIRYADSKMTDYVHTRTKAATEGAMKGYLSAAGSSGATSPNHR